MNAPNTETHDMESAVHLLDDTLGAAALQVGLVITLSVVAHYASSLLFDVVFR